MWHSNKLTRIAPLYIGVFTGGLVFLFAVVVINAQPHGWLDWYSLASVSQDVQGVITHVEPENHSVCYFEYRVESVRYEGVDQGCRLDVGRTATVHYLPDAPQVSTTSSPSEQFALLVLGPLFLSVLGGCLSGWSMSRCRRRYDKRGN